MGGVGYTSFLVGLSREVFTRILDLLETVSQRLASRGSPALSWFFAVAERTFGCVSKSKLNFGVWILNSSFDHLLSILGVCSMGL